MDDWKRLGGVPPTALVDARLALHHAAQIAATAGVTFLAPTDDDSHPNLGWDERHGALVGRALPGAGVRVGLRVADPELRLVAADGRRVDGFPLAGRTLEDGYAWLDAATARAGVPRTAGGIERASYDLPEHPVATGAAFAVEEPDAYEELARWFADGDAALRRWVARTPGATEARVWPHHFDLGTLLVVAEGPDGALEASVGVGLSPGDDFYAEPYVYVSPWPYPDPARLPPLDAGGSWRTEDFTSAILTGTELVAGPPETQAARFEAFVDAAVEASRRALGG